MPETQYPKSEPSCRAQDVAARAPRNAVLIVNTRARRGKEWYARTQQCLKEAGMTLDAAHELTDPSHLPNLLQDSLKKGARLLIVGGGDGSLRTAAEVLACKDATLGVLPLGTVNDFARNLGIESTVEAACKVIAEGRVEKVDLGQANEHYFTITASLGFSALTQNSLSPGLKKAFGPLGYLMAGIAALRQLRPVEITLHSEQGDECVKAVQAGVINGHYSMGGKLEIPGVNLESGRLAFYAVPLESGKAYLNMARHLLRSQFFHIPGLRSFTTRDMTIATPTPLPLVIDGDLCGQTPVHLRIVPDALNVCVPANFEKVQQGNPTPAPK